MSAQFPAVAITWTVNGIATTRTVPVSIVPDYVDVGGALIPGVVIQPEDVATAFPDWTDCHADDVSLCVAYAWNDGGVSASTWDQYSYYAIDPSAPGELVYRDDGALSARFNDATRDACDTL
jgi:hypothetical protein